MTMTEERVRSKPLPAIACPECGGSSLMHDKSTAEVVCTSCGFVITTKQPDRGPEWRAFTPEQQAKKVRVGAPATFLIHDKGLSTNIEKRDIRGYPTEKRAQLHRLRRWQTRIRFTTYQERNLASALTEMHRVADSLKLPKNVLETAAITYRKAIKKHLTRGRSVRAITVATLYLACRQCKLLRTIEELSQAAGIRVKEVVRHYRLLVKNLGYFVSPQKANSYIAKFCTELGLRGDIEETAFDILQVAKELKLTYGRAAKGVAAAACYIASKISRDYRTQREVAEVARITEVTLRNRYKEFMKRAWIVVTI
ncbi:MAG: TFIIB-type zinc ribbon-containing protein [Candidatus Bathyarchaeota archaeon]|jgi:transcription initiation factor TFIIB